MRTCPFHGCAETIPGEYFACKRHWYSMNRRDRVGLAVAYNAFLDGRLTLAELRRKQQEILGDRGSVEEKGGVA
jgi:hypothetical protein